MAKEQHESDGFEESSTAFNAGNLLFGFLGAWCASVVCLMIYTTTPEAPFEENRSPAQAIPSSTQAPTESFEPTAYLLSFNSIHFEK